MKNDKKYQANRIEDVKYSVCWQKWIKISPHLRWYERKYHHILPCFWSSHQELPIHRFPGEEFLEDFSIPKIKVDSRSKWSLEFKPYHFASLFEVLPPSNSQVNSGIAFYNLSYACRIRLVVVSDGLNPLCYGPMDARALWTTCRTFLLFSYKKNFPFAHELFSACLWDSLPIHHMMHLNRRLIQILTIRLSLSVRGYLVEVQLESQFEVAWYHLFPKIFLLFRLPFLSFWFPFFWPQFEIYILEIR